MALVNEVSRALQLQWGLRQELSISSQHPPPREEALPHPQHTVRFPSNITGNWLCVHWISALFLALKKPKAAKQSKKYCGIAMVTNI